MTAPFYIVRIGGIDTTASIGIHGFEQAARQKLLVSVVLLLDPPQLSSQEAGDQIASVQDYDFVREGVLKLVSGGHFNLQETLCSAILDLCLAQKGVLGAVVQTDKPDVYPGVAAVACRMARMGPRLSDFPWWTVHV
jgi:dihydroneopterin aldolase